jgi:MYXO-CTERM domain-containing protein
VSRSLALSLVLAVTSVASAQGFVQQRDPRRPPPLAAAGGCELWVGDIHGNDPSAEITVQLCSDGDAVTGTFLWSSLESGWDRRTLEGRWGADRATLTAHDTAMLEVHPLNGWRLCTADRYDLHRVSPTRLEGTYESASCHDHGNLAMNLREGSSVAPLLPIAPSPGAYTHGATRNRLWDRLGCSASPRGHKDPSRVAYVTLAAVLFVGLARRRRRGLNEAQGTVIPSA